MLYRKYTHEPQCNETLQNLENIQPIQPSKLLEGHAPVVQLLLRPWTPWQHGIRTLPPPSRMRLKISKHPNLAGSTQVPLVPCNMPTKPGSWSIQSSHPTPWSYRSHPKLKMAPAHTSARAPLAAMVLQKKTHFRVNVFIAFTNQKSFQIHHVSQTDKNRHAELCLLSPSRSTRTAPETWSLWWFYDDLETQFICKSTEIEVKPWGHDLHQMIKWINWHMLNSSNLFGLVRVWRKAPF